MSIKDHVFGSVQANNKTKKANQKTNIDVFCVFIMFVFVVSLLIFIDRRRSSQNPGTTLKVQNPQTS